MEEQIRVEVRNAIAVITLNHPDGFNAFDGPMITDLTQKLIAVSTDRDILGVVLTGAGKAFCAGGDLKWLTRSGMTPGATFHALAAVYHRAVTEIRRTPKPVVAALNGLTAGGGFSMALACDFRVMEKSAILRQAYTSNGLSVDGGGTYTLPRLVGLAKAMEILAFDRPISADQALSWGLVTAVVENGQALGRARDMILEIANLPLTSFQASKKLLTDSFHTAFERQLEKERELLAWCADQPDGREGIQAFIEKRSPVYNRKEPTASGKEE